MTSELAEHFPVRRRTRQERLLLYAEQARGLEQAHVPKIQIPNLAWGQVEIMAYTTQSEAESLHLLIYHPK